MALRFDECVLSKFNGALTPKGSYRAKTGDDCNVDSSRYRLSTALCESIRYQTKSEQNVRQDQGPVQPSEHSERFVEHLLRLLH